MLCPCLLIYMPRSSSILLRWLYICRWYLASACVERRRWYICISLIYVICLYAHYLFVIKSKERELERLRFLGPFQGYAHFIGVVISLLLRLYGDTTEDNFIHAAYLSKGFLGGNGYIFSSFYGFPRSDWVRAFIVKTHWLSELGV